MSTLADGQEQSVADDGRDRFASGDSTVNGLFSRAGNSILMIVELESGIFLYEFRKEGLVGDTWHRTVEDAKHQAAYSFGKSAGVWQPIPAGKSDWRAFARELLD
jgi:hypothetical protein